MEIQLFCYFLTHHPHTVRWLLLFSCTTTRASAFWTWVQTVLTCLNNNNWDCPLSKDYIIPLSGWLLLDILCRAMGSMLFFQLCSRMWRFSVLYANCNPVTMQVSSSSSALCRVECKCCVTHFWATGDSSKHSIALWTSSSHVNHCYDWLTRDQKNETIGRCKLHAQ